MISARTASRTLASLVAFAANSLLARAALAEGAIGPTAFTAIRLASGAAILWLLARLLGRLQTDGDASFAAGRPRRSFSRWISPAALFVYAISFSYAYLSLDAGTGALILFGSVQITMIAWGLARGERPGAAVWLGFGLAVAGLVYLLAPSELAPDLFGATLMAASGSAWGVYSIRGKGQADPIAATASNFARSLPLAGIAVALVWIGSVARGADLPPASSTGLTLAALSGALTSGLGYVIWYAALPKLSTTTAAIVQLAVPVIAAVGGILFLQERLTLHLVLSGSVILAGVAIAVVSTGRSGQTGRAAI